MKRAIFISICLSVVFWSACQRSETTGSIETETSAATASEAAGSTTTETATSAMAAATAPYDLQFVDSLTKHHQMAIDMAKAGEQKFSHQLLKGAVRKMIVDQTREVSQLRQWREQWYPGAPSAENMQMPGMASTSMDVSHMQMMSGSALDLMFIDMMIPHHEGALTMGQDALAKAEHAELKDLARKMIDAQRKEIDQMQKWKKAWAK